MPCCLCSNPEAPYQEQRRSGNAGELEPWHFCRECWNELQRQRADTDLEICQRYELFVKYVLGGYNVEAMFIGVRASRIALPNQGEKNVIDSDNSMSIESFHETITDEHSGRPSQEIQEVLPRSRQANDGHCFEADRGLLDEGRGQAEENINPLEAGMPRADTSGTP